MVNQIWIDMIISWLTSSSLTVDIQLVIKCDEYEPVHSSSTIQQLIIHSERLIIWLIKYSEYYQWLTSSSLTLQPSTMVHL